LRWAILQKNVFNHSEQDFNQNVGEVAYSIYLAVYWPIAQNVGALLGNKDNIHIYPHVL